MAGDASYTDPEVQRAMELWKELVDAGYFAPNANADDWTDASDKVARGDAAMTLMGTWITGYWNGQDLMAGDDYDFFEFPAIDAGVPNAVVGPVDGWLISANSPNRANAEALVSFLASDAEVQAKWAQIQGALSANVNVDVSTYTPVMQRALEAVGNADTFAFNYDLATTPPAAEFGPGPVRPVHGQPGRLHAAPGRHRRGCPGGVRQPVTRVTGLTRERLRRSRGRLVRLAARPSPAASR